MIYAKGGASRVAGYPRHIVQRSHRRQAIFAQDEDCMGYLENFQELKVIVYACCLMTNHVHLLLQPGEK